MAIPERQRERLERLAAAPDAEIDTSDIPEILDWSGAVRAGLHGPRKTVITIRLDTDVLAWFKAASENGAAYQSEINPVLRYHMERAAKAPEQA